MFVVTIRARVTEGRRGVTRSSNEILVRSVEFQGFSLLLCAQQRAGQTVESRMLAKQIMIRRGFGTKTATLAIWKLVSSQSWGGRAHGNKRSAYVELAYIKPASEFVGLLVASYSVEIASEYQIFKDDRSSTNREPSVGEQGFIVVATPPNQAQDMLGRS